MSFDSNAPTPEHDIQTLYAINFSKIKKGLDEKWFGSTNIKQGNKPKDIVIDENEPIHFVQILFIIKEDCSNENKWVAFTKSNLVDMIKKDEKYYIENDMLFGKKFVDQFPSQIDFFIQLYCDEVGYY